MCYACGALFFGRDIAGHTIARGCYGPTARATCGRPSTGTRVLCIAPSGHIRTHCGSTGAALRRQPAGPLRSSLHPTRGRRTGSCESLHGVRPVCVGHDPAAQQPHDGNGGRTMPTTRGVLRGPNASAAQYPLVCHTGGELLRSCRPSRAVSPKSPAARRLRKALRAVASAPCPTRSRTTGSSLLHAPTITTHDYVMK